MSDRLSVLLQAAQGGDRSALDDLLREVRQAVVRYAVAHRLLREDADDLAQDVCMAVLKIVPGWQDRGRSLWAFVFTVARNKMADDVRRAVRQNAFGRKVDIDAEAGAFSLPDTAPGPEQHVLDSDGARQLSRVMDTLPRNQRDVLLLRAVVGLSGAETAEALGLSVGSVHVLQHRAVRKLRGVLGATSLEAGR